jgi:hypothetical protein
MGSWTMEGKANMIQVPTLVINGIEEFASGDAVKPFLDEIPNVRPGLAMIPEVSIPYRYWTVLVSIAGIDTVSIQYQY